MPEPAIPADWVAERDSAGRRCYVARTERRLLLVGQDGIAPGWRWVAAFRVGTAAPPTILADATRHATPGAAIQAVIETIRTLSPLEIALRARPTPADPDEPV